MPRHNEKMWTSLPPGKYGRARVHAPQPNPAWELKGLLPFYDDRYLYVLVDDEGFAVSVNSVVYLKPEPTTDEKLAAALAELADAKALLESATSPKPDEPESEPAAGEGSDWDSMRWHDLKKAAKAVDLVTSGTSSVLRLRLKEHFGEG